MSTIVISCPGKPPDITFGVNTEVLSPPNSLYCSGVSAFAIDKLALEFITFSL